ncbi:hypothetical protein TSUD_29490 [Trifolium subterraneum]|uniref:WAT1-related protein n=1 Tax=Trifolium subterraneum TaxID=3900 RepID=A0A2Z6NXC2_TRISU|nr:hypothetical protein TSUD_29490 [Trifolium subterraneum]
MLEGQLPPSSSSTTTPITTEITQQKTQLPPSSTTITTTQIDTATRSQTQLEIVLETTTRREQSFSTLETQTVTGNQQPDSQTCWQRTYPYLYILIIQAIFAAMNILMKFAINKGISNYVFVVYRNGIASSFIGVVALYVDRNRRPPMTMRIAGKIFLLSFLG